MCPQVRVDCSNEARRHSIGLEFSIGNIDPESVESGSRKAVTQEALILTSLTLQFSSEANFATNPFKMLLVGSVDPAPDSEIAAFIKLGASLSVLNIHVRRAPADCPNVSTLSYLSRI
jgi:hypothetical protein